MKLSLMLYMLLAIAITGVCSSCDKRTPPAKSDCAPETKSPSSASAMLDLRNSDELMLQGRQLSGKQAEEFENELKTNPEDLLTHVKLLGYYWNEKRKSDSAADRYKEHVFWIIENHPESVVAGAIEARIDRFIDNKAYEHAKQLWLKQVDAMGKNTRVLGNASMFFLQSDSDIAETLLKKAQAFEPNNTEWSKSLGQLYSLSAIGSSDESAKESAKKALEQFEKAYEGTSPGLERFYMLADMAKASLKANDIQKAEKYANILLEEAKQYQGDWNYGNAVHHGNIILGTVALISNDLGKAKEHLIEAGKTPGSPQLNSFGPNITLSIKLLDKGEREAVLTYFRLCKKFWKMGQDKLGAWIDAIEQGETPDFGVHIYY